MKANLLIDKYRYVVRANHTESIIVFSTDSYVYFYDLTSKKVLKTLRISYTRFCVFSSDDKVCTLVADTKKIFVIQMSDFSVEKVMKTHNYSPRLNYYDDDVIVFEDKYGGGVMKIRVVIYHTKTKEVKFVPLARDAVFMCNIQSRNQPYFLYHEISINSDTHFVALDNQHKVNMLTWNLNMKPSKMVQSQDKKYWYVVNLNGFYIYNSSFSMILFQLEDDCNYSPVLQVSEDEKKVVFASDHACYLFDVETMSIQKKWKKESKEHLSFGFGFLILTKMQMIVFKEGSTVLVY